jgi:hypothetical protein
LEEVLASNTFAVHDTMGTSSILFELVRADGTRVERFETDGSAQQIRDAVARILNTSAENTNLVARREDEWLVEVTPSGKMNDWVRYYARKVVT